MTLGEKINAANAEALKIILGAQPTLIGVGTAGEDIPGMTKKTILHSGPPVTWENMCDPTKGAVIGALIYEGLAKTPEEAEKLAASGEDHLRSLPPSQCRRPHVRYRFLFHARLEGHQ